MISTLAQHISDHFPFLKGKKILIAISGGVDSVFLTHALHTLDFSIALAHCNFDLRGNESDADEEFIKQLGQQLELKTYSIKFDTKQYALTHKVSTQVAARELRYNWFQEVIDQYQFDYVATAHHADDNLETFLINLSRGTGLEGFTGIPPINNQIVRPLLLFSRAEIEQYAELNKIEWREDQSNASTKYVRNKIRHQIIPVLKEINPQLINSFQQTTTHLKESQQIIKDSILQIKKKVTKNDNEELVTFDISKIKQLSNPKAYLFELLKDYHFTEWKDIENLLTAQAGKQVFSNTHRLIKDRDFLLLTKKPFQNDSSFIEISKDTKSISSPLVMSFATVTKLENTSKNTVFIDATRITFPLILRKWQSGDVFYPVGMQGKKKLSKFFKDEKYSLIDKENAWLLCSKNEIIWIVGKRQDRRFLATTESKIILKTHITH